VVHGSKRTGELAHKRARGRDGGERPDTLPPPRRRLGVLAAIALARHPPPDGGGTVAKDNTPAAFELSQDTDGITIGEQQIGQIQHQDAAGRLRIDDLAQFVHIVRVELTADREDHGSAARAVNSQHRRRRPERNCRAIGNGPGIYRCLADAVRRDFGNGEMLDNTNVKNALVLACESGSC
jgi:hypothetical protein